VISLNSALSSFANSDLGRDLKATIPTVLALSVAGAGPVASTAVTAALAAGSTTFISDLGKELSGLGSSLVGGVEAAVSNVENGLEKAVSGVENVVSAVASPVTYGLGALINAVA
jgi:hypothetical protein